MTGGLDPFLPGTGAGIQDPQGPATLTATGRFTESGLDAMVTVAVSPAAAPSCRYVVGWTGAKQGSPNVIG